MSSRKTATLSSGYKIPTLGYGTWQAAPGEAGSGVYEALKTGYRHLDLAKIYQNQLEVAEGIKQALAKIPGLKREDIFITSKLWNNRHRPEQVEAALDETLKELELDYLDLYLIHWPVAFPAGDDPFPLAAGHDSEVALDEGVTLSETWKGASAHTPEQKLYLADTLQAMTELPRSKVRSIGVSNFTIEHLEKITKDTGIAPAVNQVERHPKLNQAELISYAREKNIHITAYSAFGNNNFGLPLLVNDPGLKAIAERLSSVQGKEVTPAQVILAWAQIGGHSVIPKSVTPSRIRANYQEAELDDEAVKAIKKMGESPQRLNIPNTYSPRWNVNIWNEEKERDAKHVPIL